MKKLCTISFLFVLLTAQNVYSQDDVRIEWVSKISFQDFFKVGENHTFIQKCVPEFDSIITSGLLVHSNASFPGISHCKHTLRLRDTVIVSYQLNTYNKETTSELHKYVNKIVPDFDFNFHNKEADYYISNIMMYDMPVIVFYNEPNKGKQGELIISLLNQ